MPIGEDRRGSHHDLTGRSTRAMDDTVQLELDGRHSGPDGSKDRLEQCRTRVGGRRRNGRDEGDRPVAVEPRPVGHVAIGDEEPLGALGKAEERLGRRSPDHAVSGPVVDPADRLDLGAGPFDGARQLEVAVTEGWLLELDPVVRDAASADRRSCSWMPFVLVSAVLTLGFSRGGRSVPGRAPIIVPGQSHNRPTTGPVGRPRGLGAGPTVIVPVARRFPRSRVRRSLRWLGRGPGRAPRRHPEAVWPSGQAAGFPITVTVL